MAATLAGVFTLLLVASSRAVLVHLDDVALLTGAQAVGGAAAEAHRTCLPVGAASESAGGPGISRLRLTWVSAGADDTVPHGAAPSARSGRGRLELAGRRTPLARADSFHTALEVAGGCP